MCTLSQTFAKVTLQRDRDREGRLQERSFTVQRKRFPMTKAKNWQRNPAEVDRKGNI